MAWKASPAEPGATCNLPIPDEVIVTGEGNRLIGAEDCGRPATIHIDVGNPESNLDLCDEHRKEFVALVEAGEL